jgi:hypothetical protein
MKTKFMNIGDKRVKLSIWVCACCACSQSSNRVVVVALEYLAHCTESVLLE